jgi:SAM-dependent methyltransferase
MAALSRVNCPLCATETAVHPVEQYGQFHIWECSVCHLTFCDPLVYSPQAYDQGYAEAGSDLARMGDYAEHVRYAEWLAGVPDLRPYLLPLERTALRRLAQVVPAGATVLDLGCGAGRFLVALGQRGYNAFGLEVAEAPVKTLQRHGIAVRQGTLDDFPPDWPEPAAIVCFEVLEHVADPLGFLQDIAARFPRAWLLLAVPYAASRRRFDAKFRCADYPPNHLTRWNTQSLGRALVKAGYAGEVGTVHITGDHVPFAPGRLSRSKKKRRTGGAPEEEGYAGASEREPIGTRTASLKATVKRWLLSPYVAAMRLLGGSGYWLLAVALPKEKQRERWD